MILHQRGDDSTMDNVIIHNDENIFSIIGQAVMIIDDDDKKKITKKK